MNQSKSGVKHDFFIPILLGSAFLNVFSTTPVFQHCHCDIFWIEKAVQLGTYRENGASILASAAQWLWKQLFKTWHSIQGVSVMSES